MKIRNILFATIIIFFNQQSNAMNIVELQPEVEDHINETNSLEPKNIENTTLIDEDFSGENISKWKFKNIEIIGTSFCECCAQETTFIESVLTSVNISNKTTIRQKTVKKTIINALNACKNILIKKSFFSKNRIGIKFVKSIITETDFSGTFLINSFFEETDIINSDLQSTISNNASFIDCIIVDTSFRNSILVLTNFSGSRLENVDFGEGTLLYTNFSNCRLKNVNFESCTVIGSSFEGATFDNCNVQGVDFDGISLSDEQKEYLHRNGAKNVYWENDIS